MMMTKSSMVPQLLRFSVRSRKLSNVGQSWDGWPKIYYLNLLRASESTLSRWSRLHLQALARTTPHWAHVVGSRSPYVYSIRKACAPAVRTLIGWWWWWTFFIFWLDLLQMDRVYLIYKCVAKQILNNWVTIPIMSCFLSIPVGLPWFYLKGDLIIMAKREYIDWIHILIIYEPNNEMIPTIFLVYKIFFFLLSTI
jgi:hypothetical protein